ncbi:HD domain-containing protein [Candidatus Woesearchaeota archaeon]|nr:HD domain-containing protein [Candidatus Woesearchaeota archaeon]
MKDVVNLFFETGMLNRIQRTGPYAVNSRDHENVAEHCHRALLIGYILAKFENVDVAKVQLMLLVHDIPETRIWDHNKIMARYINTSEAETKAFRDQTENLPVEIKNEMRAVFKEFNDKKTKESLVAKDADLLECAVEARELVKKGITDMDDWIKNVKNKLNTASAKKILRVVEEMNPDHWWEGLKKIIIEENEH